MKTQDKVFTFTRSLIPKKIIRPVYNLGRTLVFTEKHFRTKEAELLERKSLLTASEKEELRSMSCRISNQDMMYQGNMMHYFKIGFSAIQCIEEVLKEVDGHEIKTILDLPCGHGRVLRHFSRKFPEAKVVASDLDRNAVSFCEGEFKAVGVPSQVDLNSLSFPFKFDLIWCGSLVTHFDADHIRALLQAFRRHLSEGGVLVFSSHGVEAARRMQAAGAGYSLSQTALDALIHEYLESGYGYQDYAGETGIGVSLTHPDWLRNILHDTGFREVYFGEHAWDDHHDIFGVVC